MGVWVGGGAWLTQRQKAIRRVWGVDVVLPSGAMGTKSDFEIIMTVGKRLYRSMFYCRNTSTLLKVRAITELFS